jgi:hypothetical protein
MKDCEQGELWARDIDITLYFCWYYMMLYTGFHHVCTNIHCTLHFIHAHCTLLVARFKRAMVVDDDRGPSENTY